MACILFLAFFWAIFSASMTLFSHLLRRCRWDRRRFQIRTPFSRLLTWLDYYLQCFGLQCGKCRLDSFGYCRSLFPNCAGRDWEKWANWWAAREWGKRRANRPLCSRHPKESLSASLSQLRLGSYVVEVWKFSSKFSENFPKKNFSKKKCSKKNFSKKNFSQIKFPKKQFSKKFFQKKIFLKKQFFLKKNLKKMFTKKSID